ncbi:MAG TPA: hypothetical protein VJS92_03010 [Candidatus Polarisedimenticolaceae bacterium]|nr:hypothetical protein [Candidatus Polarisedimenticolaceae bacterium]
MRRRLSLIVVAVAASWLAVSGALFAVMLQPPEKFGRIMARVPPPWFVLLAVLPFETMWNVARGGDLQPGSLAPDFELERLGQPAGRVRLSAFRGDRPVALVFGSFT